MKKIAIVTGATGGIGGEFVRELSDMGLDEVWAVGRNDDKLAAFSGDIVAIKADIASSEGVGIIRDKLEAAKPDVRVLVNNAGTAFMGKFVDMSEGQIEALLDINCKACVLLARIVLPYMAEGSVIYNISSASSFQPNPYLTMYSASKVFVKNFSRALNVELAGTGIRAIAVCPGWVDTDMLPKVKDGKPIKYPGLTTAEHVVRRAFADAKKGKDVSVPTFYNKFLRLYVRFTPTRLVMKMWARAMKDYV